MTQNYMLLLFFTFCYITIDEGMMMINAEIRHKLDENRAKMKRAQLRKMRKDTTLDNRRI